MNSLQQMAKDPKLAAASSLTPAEIKEFTAEFAENYAKIYKAYTNGDALSEPIVLYPTSEFMEKSIDAMAAKIPLHSLIARLAGKEMLTEQFYTKPVYFVTNELDFSGGDATPALLQDYGRVKLVGVRTAGAGGTVEAFSSYATGNLQYHLTTSLMYRKGGKYIENYGVTPDVAFELTAKDYQEKFANTFDRLMTQLGI